MSSAGITVIFPIAGTMARSGFKYRPFLELGDDTFVEAAAKPFRVWSQYIDRYVFVCLQEQEVAHDVRRRLAMMFADQPHEVVMLDCPTRGPADTVSRGIEAARVRGPVIVCDCDHSIDVGPLFRAIGDRAAECLLSTWKLKDEDLRAWSIAAVSEQKVTGIAEKQLPQGNGDFVGVIGCTYFSEANKVFGAFNPDDGAYVSDVVRRMIADGTRVLAVPIEKAEFFGDPRKLRSARARHNQFVGSVFCDVDGVLVRHEDAPTFDRPLEVLETSVDRLREWVADGYYVILTTARDASHEPAMRGLLEAARIPFHQLVMGLPSGPRFLINDRKPSAALMSQAQAFEVERNRGIAHISLTQSHLVVLRRFKGGSFAETLLVEDDEKLFVRKRVSKRENLSLGYSKLKNQYRTLERFSRLSSTLVPALYQELDNTFEYCYDMEYLPQHRLLSQCAQQERGAALSVLLQTLGERVYATGARHGRAGIEWLESHLTNKIYNRLDTMLGQRRLAPLVTSAEISIDEQPIPGLQALLERVSKAEVLERLAPEHFCAVHGDLTFENVLFANGDVRLIDMDGADYVDAPELDLGKLYQSIVAQYEDWAHSAVELFESAQGAHVRTMYRVPTVDSSLTKICDDEWARILGTTEEHVRTKGLFYMGLHLLRMVPFRLKVSEEQAIYALTHGIKWIARAIEEI